MSTKEHSQRFAQALNRTGLVQVRQEHFDTNLLRMLCRVQKGMDDKWVAMVRNLLIATENERGEPHTWSAHICRNYFLLGDDQKMVYGWNVSISSALMSESLDYVIRVLKGDSPARAKGVPGELSEMPLSGTTATRNRPNEKGKGVHFIGSNKENGFRPPVKR